METPQKKLKTYNFTYLMDPENPYSKTEITYHAENIEAAKEEFYKDYPEQNKKGLFLSIHSPLSNYEVDEYNASIDLATYDPKEHWDNPAENTNDADTTTTNKLSNIQTSFQVLHVYTKSIVLLLVGIIALSLVISAVFGPNTPFYSVVENIGNIVSNINNFSGFLVVMGLTAFLTIFYTKN